MADLERALQQAADDVPFSYHTKPAQQWSDLDPVTDAGVTLYFNYITIENTIPRRLAKPTITFDRMGMVTRSPLDLDNPTELRSAFGVQQEDVSHRVKSVHERKVRFSREQLAELHPYTRGVDKSFIGGPQAAHANELDAQPRQRLLVPFPRPAALQDDPASGRSEAQVDRELGLEEGEIPGGAITPEVVADWVCSHMDRGAVDEMIQNLRSEGTTLGIIGCITLVTQGFDRWWRALRFGETILNLEHQAGNHLPTLTGAGTGRPSTIESLAFLGDRFLELLARLAAAFAIIGSRAKWDKDRFHNDTKHCKTNRSLYIPMIRALVHLCLFFEPFDPRRFLPNPPDNLRQFGLAFTVTPTFKHIGDLAEALLGYRLLWHNDGDVFAAVRLFRKLGITLPNIPRPFLATAAARFKAPLTERSRGILQDEPSMLEFQTLLGCHCKNTAWLHLILEGTSDEGEMQSEKVKLSDDQKLYWNLLKKLGNALFEMCLCQEFMLACPTGYRRGEFTDLLHHELGKAEWVTVAVRESEIMEFFRLTYTELTWFPFETEWRKTIVELLMAAVFVDSGFSFAPAQEVYGRFLGDSVREFFRLRREDIARD